MIKFFDVWCLVKKIPRGKVATYGQIATILGHPDQAQVVGWALHANQSAQVPCHRVVNRDGCLAKSFGRGGQIVQRRLLFKEKVVFTDRDRVDLKKCLINLGL